MTQNARRYIYVLDSTVPILPHTAPTLLNYCPCPSASDILLAVYLAVYLALFLVNWQLIIPWQQLGISKLMDIFSVHGGPQEILMKPKPVKCAACREKEILTRIGLNWEISGVCKTEPLFIFSRRHVASRQKICNFLSQKTMRKYILGLNSCRSDGW